jgi:hypothetical protein
MTVYTFYPMQTDGTALSFAIDNLQSDLEAVTLARQVIDEHTTCRKVTIWNDDRLVHTVRAGSK